MNQKEIYQGQCLVGRADVFENYCGGTRRAKQAQEQAPCLWLADNTSIRWERLLNKGLINKVKGT